ncbi:hypothetical protein PCANC_26293 [Puccinia coronata f. sp. avenae]|uniref:GAF domain-containing protein n=1 Tax=Puccinia coronata f. sp. avenae TaxID=200324 RepID=A0A2N5S336_9BASI|nr:hypothetical protein PCANC_26293 [Puccinia coronata f. sp. avenae]
MAQILASPRGITLPYSSLYNVNLRAASDRAERARPSAYFWDKATHPTPWSVTLSGDEDQDHTRETWLDPDAALSDSEDGSSVRLKRGHSKSRKLLPFTRLRRIAFRVFCSSSPDARARKRNTVTSTEVISRQIKRDESTADKSKTGRGITIFKSWKSRSIASNTSVKKMVVVLKERISASSPREKHPTTWLEYNRMYGSGQIDVCNPPVPLFGLNNTDEDLPEPSSEPPFVFYSAPRPENEPVRQLVVNRLGLLGKASEPTDEGLAEARARIQRGDELIAEGKVPSSLEAQWEGPGSITNDGNDFTIEETRGMISDVRSGKLPPESLEQHPIFRNVVKRCRELFGSALSILSILDDDRQIFLAESGMVEAGMGEMRDVTRDLTFCAHTILGDSKGMTVLDAKKDWRFEKSPLAEAYGVAFYAGVPLLAPNLDGSPEADQNPCPIGTLCIVDFKPRPAFSAEDQKKLIYISEYVRREIEKWFASKIAAKMERLAATQAVWNQELKGMTSSHSDVEDSQEMTVPLDTTSPQATATTYSNLSSGFKKWRSVSSLSTAPPTSPSYSHMTPKPPIHTGPGLFEDFNAAVKPKMRKVFDLATKLVAETLDLSLVYLMAVIPYGDSQNLGQTIIISGHNIPLPVPELDAGLHLRVLEAAEGGLLYQNPSVQESEEAGLQPKINTDGPTDPHVSAMLLKVGAPSLPSTGGFVLAGFTKDPKRVFGAEDVSFMKQFAQQLSVYTKRIPLCSN